MKPIPFFLREDDSFISYPFSLICLSAAGRPFIHFRTFPIVPREQKKKRKGETTRGSQLELQSSLS